MNRNCPQASNAKCLRIFPHFPSKASLKRLTFLIPKPPKAMELQIVAHLTKLNFGSSPMPPHKKDLKNRFGKSMKMKTIWITGEADPKEEEEWSKEDLKNWSRKCMKMKTIWRIEEPNLKEEEEQSGKLES